MASSQFNERFKNRSQVLGKYGEMQISPSSSILKSPIQQSPIFSSASKQALHTLNGGSGSYADLSKPCAVKSQLAIPCDSDAFGPSYAESPMEVSRRAINLTPLRSKIVQVSYKELIKQGKTGTFTPYTLKDYTNIKPEGYYMLGSLGPSTGTEVWKAYKEKEERRKLYINRLQPSQSKASQDLNQARQSKSVLRSSLKILLE
ncbi:unnamed protein product [Blepharisma stoltei]|uniref:Uncharacterized protein n=1 Tax=Blepharisma stoltei TaxID=1481888 RepID=A0AAU9IRM0_9CILI|nr:unnamed protein product [Blepharisma stoltei]